LRSSHPVIDLDVYRRSIEASFRGVFGAGPFTIAAHLPGYIENGSESSLLYMVEYLIENFGDGDSGHFLEDLEDLEHFIRVSERSGHPLILFGAAFGLLDICEKTDYHLPENAIVIETGGMKTYRKEISRDDLHNNLASGFGVRPEQIYSEYGMCEMLSQCYTRGGKTFYPPAWLDVGIVDPVRPWIRKPVGEVGAIAVFDCANLYSVSAILSEDRGVKRNDGSFEVLGRLDNAEMRGCNFLLESMESN